MIKLGCIEENWEDGTIYFVEFLTSNNKKIAKVIVLPTGYSKKEIEHIVLEKFSGVKKVNCVDLWDDCLILLEWSHKFD